MVQQSQPTLVLHKTRDVVLETLTLVRAANDPHSTFDEAVENSAYTRRKVAFGKVVQVKYVHGSDHVNRFVKSLKCGVPSDVESIAFAAKSKRLRMDQWDLAKRQGAILVFSSRGIQPVVWQNPLGP
jgi:hypothetical protein